MKHVMFPALLLVVAGLPAAAFERVEVSAPTVVYDRSDPAFCANCSDYKRVELTDPARLAALDGVGPPDAFADYLAEGTDEEIALAQLVSGGQLRLAYSAGQGVLAKVSYRASRALTPAELALVADFTVGRLLDGIGEGFTQSGTRQQQAWVEFDVMDSGKVSVSQGPAEPTATVDEGAVRTDGMYQALTEHAAQVGGRKHEASYKYLRFYPDGVVVEVSSIGLPGQIVGWFNAGNADLFKGAYSVSADGDVAFTTRGDIGAIEYRGRFEGDELVLASDSKITGYRQTLRFRFVPDHE